jgi:hypothetical protein
MMCPRFSRAAGEGYYQVKQNEPWMGYDVTLKLAGIQLAFQVRPLLETRFRLPRKQKELERLALALPGQRCQELDKLVQVHCLVQGYLITPERPLPSLDAPAFAALMHAGALALRILAWLEESYLNADVTALKKTAGIPCNDHCTLCGSVCKHNANICNNCAADLL